MPALDPSSGLALITDGSANYRDRSGGWAWVAVDAYEGLQSDSGYAGDTTISVMELLAPTKGLDYLFGEFGPCEVLIYSDSLYVVKGASDRSRKRHKNLEQWSGLDDAMLAHSHVEFHHVRGHNDHFYNEMADQMAGEARKRGR